MTMLDEEAGETLDVPQAMQSIEKALAYDALLRVRGEGLSWMVWGLVSALMILLFETFDFPYQVWYVVVPLTWGGLGLVSTSAVWHLAGVARPALSPRPLKVALWIAAAAIGIVLTMAIGWTVYEATGRYVVLTMLLATVPWALVGWAQWSRMSPHGQRATVVLGVVMAVGFAGAVELTDAAQTASLVTWSGVTAGLPFLLGLFWTFRR